MKKTSCLSVCVLYEGMTPIYKYNVDMIIEGLQALEPHDYCLRRYGQSAIEIPGEGM